MVWLRACRRSHTDLVQQPTKTQGPGGSRFPGLFVFMSDLLPLFVKLTGRAVLLVGGGPVAAGKLQQLLAAGADVRVVAPEISAAIAEEAARTLDPDGRVSAGAGPHVTLFQRAFVPADLDDAWLVVAAATPDVNRAVAAAAEARRVFVNAVDDPPNASAYLSGVVRRDGVTIAVSTDGAAPALTALLREGLDALLPRDLAEWMKTAAAQRAAWRRDAVPMEARKPRLLRALNALYEATAQKAVASFDPSTSSGSSRAQSRDDEPRMSEPSRVMSPSNHERPAAPWLTGPEDSWP
jgi:siroheme synthase-like protein